LIENSQETTNIALSSPACKKRDVGFLVMTLPSDLPPELAHRGVRPADRLGFTLFLAALIHLALLLGVGFSMVEPKQISKTLEITLATFKSEKKPDKADFLAQEKSGRQRHPGEKGDPQDHRGRAIPGQQGTESHPTAGGPASSAGSRAQGVCDHRRAEAEKSRNQD